MTKRKIVWEYSETIVCPRCGHAITIPPNSHKTSGNCFWCDSAWRIEPAEPTPPPNAKSAEYKSSIERVIEALERYLSK